MFKYCGSCVDNMLSGSWVMYLKQSTQIGVLLRPVGFGGKNYLVLPMFQYDYSRLSTHTLLRISHLFYRLFFHLSTAPITTKKKKGFKN